MRIQELERKQQEHERRLSLLEQMARCRDHLRYHTQMTNQQREYWYREGIFDGAIDRWRLGWCESCPTCKMSASYTLPVFDAGGDLVDIRHRLVDEDGGGKYRPHVAGLGQNLYGADKLPERCERLLVLEGEKKTVVYAQAGYPAVGVMGASGRWRRLWFDWIERARPQSVVMCFDPSAEEHAWRLGEAFAEIGGFRDVRVAEFPVKPDDMVVRFGAGADDVEAVLQAARPVN